MSDQTVRVIIETPPPLRSAIAMPATGVTMTSDDVVRMINLLSLPAEPARDPTNEGQ